MPEWIVTLFGESLAPIVWVVIVAAMVCLLAIVLIVIARKVFGGGGLPASFKSRVPRLQVLDMTRIDEKRRLVLVRRDEVEHLILIGGQTDIVVEPGILRLPSSGIDSIDTRNEGLGASIRTNAAAVTRMDRSEREPRQGRTEPETAVSEDGLTEPARWVASPVASPSPMPVENPRRQPLSERRDHPAAGPAHAPNAPLPNAPLPKELSPNGPSPKKRETGAGGEGTKPYSDRLAARMSTPVENATAALAAAMPSLMRSRSAGNADARDNGPTVRTSPPRSLATPTMPAPTMPAPPDACPPAPGDIARAGPGGNAGSQPGARGRHPPRPYRNKSRARRKPRRTFPWRKAPNAPSHGRRFSAAPRFRLRRNRPSR